MCELRRQHPYEFFTRGNVIRSNVEQVKRRRWVYEPRYTDFNIPGAVQDWLDVEFAQEVSVYRVYFAARPLRAALLNLLDGVLILIRISSIFRKDQTGQGPSCSSGPAKRGKRNGPGV